MATSLREWLQKNQVYDKDLLRLWPKYGVNNPDTDLYKLSAEQWAECKNILLSEKRAELKDNAANQRFEKKLNKLTKLWKAQRKKHASTTKRASTNSIPVKPSQLKTRVSTKKRASTKLKLKSTMSAHSPYSPYTTDGKQEEYLRILMENRKLRRELSSKNGDYNRLQQEFNSYKLQKEKEIKALNAKYSTKTEEYNKLLGNYRQLNQRINSKYHDNSAKDKEIDNLKSDKSTLLNDINTVMTEEQGKYEDLMRRYNQLKEINNQNEKYKLKYKRKKRRSSRKGGSFSVGINQDDHWDETMDQIKEVQQEQKDYYRDRHKKYKPSREKRAKARQRSEILASQRKQNTAD
eukprot:11341_1